MDYRIIGGDGQEYGPVPESTIREWISDGRLNGFSKIRPSDEPVWSTVGELPQFSAALAVPEQSPAATTAVPGRIDVGECLSVAFSLFGRHWVPLVLGALIYLAISLAFGLVLSVLSTPFSMSAQEMLKGGTANPLHLTWQIPLYLVSLALSIGLTALLYAGGFRFLIRVVRGAEPDIADIFAAFRSRTIPVVLCGLLSSVIWFVGYVLCILPGIYLQIAYIYAPLIALESNVGVWQSLEASRRAITPQWWQMFLLALLMIAFCIVGFLLCGVGLLVAYPICGLMFAKAYCDLFAEARPAGTTPPAA